jgi:S-DNA-T family DNA segregation ATPase FtsK/SpoIIIE
LAQAAKKSQPERSSSRRPRVAARRRPAVEEKKPKGNELLAFILGAFGLFLLLSLYSHIDGLYSNDAFVDPSALAKQNSMGFIGYRVARILFRLLGWCSLISVIWSWLLARSVYKGTIANGAGRIIIGGICSVVLAVSAATISSIFYDSEGGGSIGLSLSSALLPYLNRGGTVLLAAFIMTLSFVASTGVELAEVFGLTAKTSKHLSKGAAVGLSAAGKAGTKAVAAQIGVSKFLFTKTAAVVKNRRERAPQVVDKAWEFNVDDNAFEEKDFVDEVPELKKKAAPAPLLLLPPKVIEVEPEVEAEEEEYEVPLTKPKVSLKERLKRKKKREVKKENSAYSGSFSVPPLDLLTRSEGTGRTQIKDDELLKNCKLLEKSLSDFKLGGKIVEVQPGPVITLYEFEPAPGVKVQRIISLADDLALALKVASVRVYAPVPGKGTVGIEVPNQNREVVWLRDILDCDAYSQDEAPLLLALGKDTFGEPYVADLAKMPHLLIAGATGTGKSVSINSLLVSLLYRSTPEKLRLIMIDPKMLELSVYEKIPHLKAPVVTNPKRARGVLWWAVEEMERRYRLMMDLGVRNLDGYNQLIEQDGPKAPPRRKVNEHGETEEFAGEVLDKLPHIVIIVDEFADLMLTVGREVEELITRLAQKARAAGIHLILATQRPSVNVITGLIKANFPSRISFKVASRIDSRTVLDGSGAERLLGHGDMLFVNSGAGRPRRLHGAFVSDAEVHQVVKWWRSQGAPDYDPQIEEMITKLNDADTGEGMGTPDAEFEYDPLYDQALKVVIDKGQASTSMIQRVFRIGYNRAARILEMMERDGVVGPADGAKPRQILAQRLAE